MQAMNFSGTYANGTGCGVSYNYAAQPAGSSNSVPSQLIPDSGQTLLSTTHNIADTGLDWESLPTFGETLVDEIAPYSAGRNFTSITELAAFVLSDEDSHESTMEMDDSSQDDGALSSHSSSFNSDMSELYQLATTLVGQGELVIEAQSAGGGSLQNLQDLEAVADFIWMDVDQCLNWRSELYEAHSLMQTASQIENMNAGSFNVEAAESFVILPSNVPETCSAPAEVSRLSKWQGFVWLVRACHRISSSLRAKVATSAMFKGVVQKRGKWVCEKRIAKKMMLMSTEKLSDKVWLGTYKTCDQAARALDVAKFFFSAKGSKKSFFDPNSERILSKNCSHLLARPLNQKLVDIVKKIAKHYGENNGSLQNLTLLS